MTRKARVLILGGTAEARELAALLVEGGTPAVTSLAGVTHAPVTPPGEVRLGGFGGVAGLMRYCRDAGITVIADATHPFAVRISANAHLAAEQLGIPCLRLERPAWQAGEGDNWIGAACARQAADKIEGPARVLLTTGRKELSPFFNRGDLSGLIRTIEQLDAPPPARWQVLRDRPPYSIDEEMSLLRREAIGVLVTKNAGGDQTSAKLAAARAFGIRVVVIARPPKPGAVAATTAAALAALILHRPA